MNNATVTETPAPRGTNPLLRFSLRGQSADLEKMAVEQKPLLGSFCLSGQSTVLCAPPNAGKTLLTISAIIEAIEAKRISGDDVIYINADDTTQGLAEKLRVLEDYGVHMIAEGYSGFRCSMLADIVERMVDEDTARGKFIVLDTFKKSTQLMSKVETSRFTAVVRRFILRGGSLLCLSHTNKSPDVNGRSVYAGVSDIMDDLDGAYLIDLKAGKDGVRTATLRNLKRRGNTPDAVAYTYSGDPELSYLERLTSVVEVDPEDGREDQQADGDADDDNVLEHIALTIRHGPERGKMEIVRFVARLLSIPRRRVLSLMEAHTGEDPEVHRWSRTVLAHGKHAFALVTPLPGS